MRLGLDYSQGPPTGAQVRAASYGFVIRYLENGLPGRVNLSAAEVASMQANGVDVALIWESQDQRATTGLAAGAADAAVAKAAAATVGLDGWPIYFAVDFDIPDYAPASADPLAKLGPVGLYFQGVRSALPLARVGVYGGFYAVSRVLDAGLASLAWQTVAWSGGQIDPRIAVFQNLAAVTVGGVGCDVNEQRADYFGQAVPSQTTGSDHVFEFIANTDSPLATPGSPLSAANGYTVVSQLVGGGYVVPARWADVAAKDKAWGGDGTGSVLGVPAAQYQHFVDLDGALRARDAHLYQLTSVAAPATPTTYDIATQPGGVVIAKAIPEAH